ncbi:MAG: single-stranded-DNA-specific exonuclease RecJ [Candidatus Eisenbacteria bacterium]|nr:single-stranded-DNA-specific exonuclease RecJ [Candidatus Eisenbacteria bacterium]
MRWVLKEPAESPGPAEPDPVPRLVRRLLRARGLASDEQVRAFLAPALEDLSDSALLPDVAPAIERLRKALDRRETIFVFGDYDVDGLTATALMCRYLERLGANVRARVPERLGEGYGLSPKIVEEAESLGARLLIAADSGTNAREAVAKANALGIDVIVADHHQIEGDLPRADAVVNPWREDSSYPFPDLAAVGIVARLLDALWRSGAGSGQGWPSPREYLDLVALGTIADNVRLEGDNRILAHAGLSLLRRAPRPAMRALMKVAGVVPERLGSSDVGYRLAPRLNAAGRVGEASVALSLLLCDDEERCQALAMALDCHNQERRRLLDRVEREATEMAEADPRRLSGAPLLLQSDRWHPGVLGIAAARMADRFGVPAILLASDGATLRGSGRTAGRWDLLDLVRLCADDLLTFGGHRAAVGLSLAPDAFERFRERFLDAAMARGISSSEGERVQEIDARADLEEVDLDFLDWLERLEPFGAGNNEPVLALKGTVSGGVRVLKDEHLKFDLTDGRTRRECIGFGWAGQARWLEGQRGDVHVAASASRNVYRGEERIQLQVRGLSGENPFGNG